MKTAILISVALLVAAFAECYARGSAWWEPLAGLLLIGAMLACLVGSIPIPQERS